MKANASRKRSSHDAQRPSKRRKVLPQANKKRPKDKPKEKASDRILIPIPALDDGEVNLSDQDMDILQTYGTAASFLNNLDSKGIARSKKEVDRLHQLNKPKRRAPSEDDDLPSIDSHDEDEDWNSDIKEEEFHGFSDHKNDSELEDEGESLSKSRSGLNSDDEMPYETIPRKRRPSWDSDNERDIQRLPIKLADGRVKQTGVKVVASTLEDVVSDDASSLPEEEESRTVEDISTGARFGRPGVIDVIQNTSRKARVQAAKDQIASICQEVVADPENSLGLLRRLHTFSLLEISTSAHPDPVPNDIVIRKLAILSQLAVFKDIIPGYRIRSLTEKEKTEKVSQMVAQTREWEQGLVVVYQTYLRSLEAQLKDKTELADVALQCICTLAVEAVHFNFRANIMSCIVARLSKKSWDKSSDLCLNALVQVLKSDLTGSPSLEIVRLLNRMIKERKYNVHPAVLSCLLHLRLKTELGVRASEAKADKLDDGQPKRKAGARRGVKVADRHHLSKTQKKARKENKEIEREMRDAEAEVDKEERAVIQTETLKLLFVLYFSILKNPRQTRLLPAALQGISKYAHLVNIDFFKDLMQVLKDLITSESDEMDSSENEQQQAESQSKDTQAAHLRLRLLCIATAFELLSGQGEALNIDLNDFVNQLYAIIVPLGLVADIETPTTTPTTPPQSLSLGPASSTSDMLFRALTLVFSPRTAGNAAPPWRSAAFAKRLLIVSLQWPPKTVLRTLDFIGGLIAKDPKLEVLLSTEDRIVDGIYRPDVDDPQLCNPFATSFWELHVLQRSHYNARVRLEARKLSSYTRS